MDFTFEELDHLIRLRLLDKNKENTFGINYISQSTNQGFGYYLLTKENSGEIVECSSTPINVDPDDGSCDYRGYTKYYKTFDDFLNNRPYDEKR